LTIRTCYSSLTAPKSKRKWDAWRLCGILVLHARPNIAGFWKSPRPTRFRWRPYWFLSSSQDLKHASSPASNIEFVAPAARSDLILLYDHSYTCFLHVIASHIGHCGCLSSLSTCIQPNTNFITLGYEQAPSTVETSWHRPGLKTERAFKIYYLGP
jgi:hypothetical protein